MSIPLHLPKLSRFDRRAEPCSIAVPLPQGELPAGAPVCVLDAGAPIPTQSMPTATWPDGSVKWLLVSFLADLPANAGKDFRLDQVHEPYRADGPVMVATSTGGAIIDTGIVRMSLCGPEQGGVIGDVRLDGEPCALDGEVVGPTVMVDGMSWTATVGGDSWRAVESGPVRLVVEAVGRHRCADGQEMIDFIARITAWAGKPWVELHYRFINREQRDELLIEQMQLEFRPRGVSANEATTALTTSNYRSRTHEGHGSERLEQSIDAEYLLYTANEQVAEVHYGVFCADWSHPDRGGLCVSIRQAYQNFPKALTVDGYGLSAGIFPASTAGLRLTQGAARGHRLLLHFHPPIEQGITRADLVVRALQHGMPDVPQLPPHVYADAGVLPTATAQASCAKVERHLLKLADDRTRGFGMLHWGDGPERGYTDQGRGRGELVWCNLEYDLPRAALLMLARTAERRFLDYMLVSAEHWMEVDVCHCSADPLRRGGMIAHSARHTTGGVTISHEWVEGLLDYYHHTGDQFALRTAVGIGENVLRHLERTRELGAGEFAARETGWALRTLVALYEETHDARWMEPADGIVDQFDEWMRLYGTWLAPYTDHTLARVPFMITVAVNSLMCYYRVRPQDRVRRMVIIAMEDLLQNCLMADGLFYYKELPSLQRRSAGTLVLEGLAHAYSLTDDDRFIHAGMPTFEQALQTEAEGYSGPKWIDGDAVIWPRGPGPKWFAASAIGVMLFSKAAIDAGALQPD